MLDSFFSRLDVAILFLLDEIKTILTILILLYKLTKCFELTKMQDAVLPRSEVGG